jgi:DNA-binding transcriptional LysR family regulator
VQARTLFVNRLVHLLEEDMDVAVRIAHLPDSGLTALPVGALRRLVVASPDYLARHGEPQHPQDLAQHRAIAFSFDARAAAPWKFAEGLVGQPQIAWISNANEVDIAATEAGLGLTRCLAYQAAASLRAGRLRIVLAGFEPPPGGVDDVHGHRRGARARQGAGVCGLCARAAGGRASAAGQRVGPKGALSFISFWPPALTNQALAAINR